MAVIKYKNADGTYTTIPTGIPNAISAFENDAGYQTEAQMKQYVAENPGPAGKDGVSITHTWNGTSLSITSASGTSEVDLKGNEGYTPIRGVDYFTDQDVDNIVQAVVERVGSSNSNASVSGSVLVLNASTSKVIDNTLYF